jgi:hypothetical protein
MKSLFTLIVLAALSFSATAQDGKTGEKSKAKTAKSSKQKLPITFKTLEIVRPNVAYGSDEPFTFEFKNTGKTPIIVSNVQTSCGCTTAEKPSEPVQPGKSSKISVKYDTKRVGDFTKTITVTTNVSDPIVLTIKGKVAPDGGNTTAPAPQH